MHFRTEKERSPEQFVRALDKYILNIIVKLGNNDSSLVYFKKCNILKVEWFSLFLNLSSISSIHLK